MSRFEPAERGSDWFVADSLDLRGSTRTTLGVTLDYAHKPLAVYDAAENEQLALVRHQLFAHVGASVVLVDRFRLGASLPVAMYQDGEEARVGGEALSAATSPAFGDARLSADVRLVGRYGDRATLAFGVRGWLPTGLRSQFTSDGAVRISPQLLAGGELGVFAWAARGAIVYRARDDTYAGRSLGSELAGSVGAGVRAGRLLIGPEIFASTGLGSDSFLSTHRTPVDAIVGVHYQHPSGLRLSGALGSGLTRGYGSPALRALLSVEWGTSLPALPADRDHDGIPDASDACPDWPGVPSGDPELNGCPSPERVPDEDTDSDGIWDLEDACPTLTGIRTSDPMTNGCPPEAPRQIAVITKTEIRIGEEVRFATDSAELAPVSDAVLAAVKRLLDEHPEIRRVRVEGHTDSSGDPAYNDELSGRRAASVVRWLTERGIDTRRLESAGYGSGRPIDTNTTEEGRAKNRRVVFTILERGPERP
ncbi:MAG: OmpA family protein [Labilithrix sp.]|nr:OmpA family protein [Labilithrix sp.]